MHNLSVCIIVVKDHPGIFVFDINVIINSATASACYDFKNTNSKSSKVDYDTTGIDMNQCLECYELVNNWWMTIKILPTMWICLPTLSSIMADVSTIHYWEVDTLNVR